MNLKERIKKRRQRLLCPGSFLFYILLKGSWVIAWEIHTQHTVGLNMYETLKKCWNKPNIFFIPLSISELTTSQNFFVTVWPPGGTNITFAENWNFELKFFLVNSFREKITSRVFWINSLSKYGSKMFKNIHSFKIQKQCKVV